MEQYAQPRGINWDQSGGHGVVSYGTDANLNVVFYKRSVQDVRKSQEQNMPIFSDIDHVRISEPGERLNVIDRPVQENDKYRFAMQWSRYQANDTQMPEGTPIELLFPNSPSTADNLKVQKVFTIQQCAKLTDHAMNTIGMGAMEWKQKAVKYLESAKEGGNFHLMQKELEAEKAKSRTLEFKVSEMLKQINDLTARINSPSMYSQQPNSGNVDIQSERINGKREDLQLGKK